MKLGKFLHKELMNLLLATKEEIDKVGAEKLTIRNIGKYQRGKFRIEETLKVIFLYATESQEEIKLWLKKNNTHPQPRRPIDIILKGKNKEVLALIDSIAKNKKLE